MCVSGEVGGWGGGGAGGNREEGAGKGGREEAHNPFVLSPESQSSGLLSARTPLVLLLQLDYG